MTRKNQFWIYIGLTAGFAIFAGSLSPIPILAEAFSVISLLCLIGAIITYPRKSWRKYDLVALKEFHEKEALREIEIQELQQFDSVQCLSCGTIFDLRIPVCPRCKSPQGGPTSG